MPNRRTIKLPLSLSWYLVLLTVLILPWYGVRGSLAGIPVTLLELVAISAVSAWLVERLITHSHPLLPARWWLAAVAVMLAATGIGLAVAPDMRSALGIAKAYLVEPMAVFVVVVDLLRRDPSRARILLAAFLLTGAQVALVAIFQMLFGWPVFSEAEYRQGRASAMYNTANAVGLLLGPLVLLAATWAVAELRSRRFITAAIITVLSIGMLVAIWWSDSLGAAIGLLAGSGVLVVLPLFKRLRWLPRFSFRQTLALVSVVIISLFLATTAYFYWWNNPPSVANPYTRPGFSTLTVRQCTWEGTIRGLDQRPLTGFGLAGFSQDYVQYATCDAEPLVYPHNHLLNFWVEFGLVGVIGLALMTIIWLSVSLFGYLRLAALEAAIALGCLAAMVYWLVHGLVDVPYFKNDLSMLWWLLAGLVAGLIGPKLSSVNAPSR